MSEDNTVKEKIKSIFDILENLIEEIDVQINHLKDEHANHPIIPVLEKYHKEMKSILFEADSEFSILFRK